MRAPNTAWACGACGAAGMVTIDPHAGAYEGIDIVTSAHRQAGTGCGGDIASIRITRVKYVSTPPVSGADRADVD